MQMNAVARCLLDDSECCVSVLHPALREPRQNRLGVWIVDERRHFFRPETPIEGRRQQEFAARFEESASSVEPLVRLDEGRVRRIATRTSHHQIESLLKRNLEPHPDALDGGFKCDLPRSCSRPGDAAFTPFNQAYGDVRWS